MPGKTWRNCRELGEETIVEELSLGRKISMDHVLDPGFLGFWLDGRAQIKLGCGNGFKRGNVEGNVIPSME